MARSSLGNDVLSKWFEVWETGKNLLGLSPENRVDGAQRISDVLPDRGKSPNMGKFFVNCY